MYYIFNTEGKNIGQCDFEPDTEDLTSRGESYRKHDDVMPDNAEIWLIDDKISIMPANKATQEERLLQAQELMWEKIKAYRHTITRGGVYIPSVKKWFHTDDSSRTQYLALQILPELPADLVWKTMDNSFVKMDKPLITELAMTILQAEQADFANAEKHRVAMMEANNPFDYDFSRGWSDTYDQQ